VFLIVLTMSGASNSNTYSMYYIVLQLYLNIDSVIILGSLDLHPAQEHTYCRYQRTAIAVNGGHNALAKQYHNQSHYRAGNSTFSIP
jgi:hypothetical protein